MTHSLMIKQEVPKQQTLQIHDHLARAESCLCPVAFEKHGVASLYFGHIPQSDLPLPKLPREVAQQAFVRGMLETPLEHGHRNPIEWMVSLGLHILVVTTVVVVPLLFTQAIDLHNFQLTYLALPKPPAAAPAPAPPLVQKVARPMRNIVPSKFTAPITIPRNIAVVRDEGLPDMSPGGVIGGVPGGETGGVLGGILAAREPARRLRQVRQQRRKTTVVRIGGDVKPPRQVLRIDPTYPPIAWWARVQGVVLIDAVIDEHGNVVQAHVVD